MDQSEIRLEIIKLVFRHDKAPADTVTVAKEIEAYVLEAEETQRPREADNSPARGRRAGRGLQPTTPISPLD